jgi:hypothetical protein
MNPSDSEREQRYQSGNDRQRFLYASDEAGLKLRDIFTSYHLRPELYRDFALTFGDVVLGLAPEGHLPVLLSERLGLPEKLASLIGHDLLEFINSPLPQEDLKPQAIPEQKLPEAPPAWSRTLATPPAAPQAPSLSEATPNPQRSLTDIPRYIKDDPYRESPK